MGRFKNQNFKNSYFLLSVSKIKHKENICKFIAMFINLLFVFVDMQGDFQLDRKESMRYGYF